MQKTEKQPTEKHAVDEPIVFEKEFDTPVSKVWRAITEKDEMKKWYFELKEFKPEKGFRFEFSGGPSPDKQYQHICVITEVISEKKLTYSWKYDGYQGISFVTFELFPQGRKTILKLTHKGIESFPKEISDFSVDNFIEGWDQIVNVSLKKHLEPLQKARI